MRLVVTKPTAIITLFRVASLGEAVPRLPVVLPAAFQLDHGSGAAMSVDDTAVSGQRLGQALGFALDAHFHGRRVAGLFRAVAVAGDRAPVDHFRRDHVDYGVVDFGHGDRTIRRRSRARKLGDYAADGHPTTAFVGFNGRLYGGE